MTSNWSPESATKAYLRALKMGKRGKEPDVGEFISALAAGNNAQLMVTVSSNSGNAKSTVPALAAAAHQTGGRTICILPGIHHIHQTKQALGPCANGVEFVVGDDARTLLLNEYKGADFVVIDCNIDGYKGLFGAAKEGLIKDGNIKGVVVGYNAFHKESWCGGGAEEDITHFLPIGEGLFVTKTGGAGKVHGGGDVGCRRRSRWVVKIDECTGEEHVFRASFERGKAYDGYLSTQR
ncbi:uncharacterized protein LOC120003658 [Tripterygium wilfordii]|uniref:uncharacterized protein LOC120003658 n=1 Tax=Tripterygium wilfordii TaxID=458696 RepID=UPI0018F84D2F|nr:uncharacterized protein LOC120003658 [Tripterygium wilfordii]